uniref:Ovule protein n=1 Tax=Mesocestoides corti TaxID=53468 RepID=A0A5K3FG82_MESCO
CCYSCLFTPLNPVDPRPTLGSPFSQHVASRANPQLHPHSHEYLSWIILTPRSRY